MRELRGHVASLVEAAFAMRETRLVTASIDGMLCVWDLADGAHVHRMMMGITLPTIAVAGREGLIAVPLTDQGEIQVLQLHDLEERVVVANAPGPEWVRFGRGADIFYSNFEGELVAVVRA